LRAVHGAFCLDSAEW